MIISISFANCQSKNLLNYLDSMIMQTSTMQSMKPAELLEMF